LPPTPESERTPLVSALLKDGKWRAHFKPSKMDEQTDEGVRDGDAEQGPLLEEIIGPAQRRRCRARQHVHTCQRWPRAFGSVLFRR
jgi:hypothetical protein